MDFCAYVREYLQRLPIPHEAEIVEELAQHLEDIYREGRDAGLDHDAAWSRAAGALPAAADDLARALRSASRTPPGRVADRWRAALDEPVPSAPGVFSMFTGLRRDCRYAVRTLVRESGFTAVIVITLALGIGGTAAVFSAVDAVLLKSVPVADPDRVVNVYTVWAARATANSSGGDQVGTSSYPDYADLRDSGVLGGLATFAGISLTLDTGGLTERIDGQVVSGNYFDVAGVRPAAGRTFSPEEDRIGSAVRVAVLSHGLWQRRFGAEIGTVGRSITLNGNAYTVIGIAPRGFAGSVLGDAPEVWVPMALQEEVRPPSAGVQAEPWKRPHAGRQGRAVAEHGGTPEGRRLRRGHGRGARRDRPAAGGSLSPIEPRSERDCPSAGGGARYPQAGAAGAVAAHRRGDPRPRDRVRERGGSSSGARRDPASRGGGPNGDRRRTRPARPAVAH